MLFCGKFALGGDSRYDCIKNIYSCHCFDSLHYPMV